MFHKFGLLAGSALLAFACTAASSAQAADYVDTGCQLSGSAALGLLYDWERLDFNDSEDGDGVDIEWTTPFGEGAGLITCGGLNVQADVAHYAHSGSSNEFDDVDLNQANSHIGGALFYRDPAYWTGGFQASWISENLFGTNSDVFRVGVFGELYLDDAFTLGAAAAYYDTDEIAGDFDDDGFELAAYGRFYATPDLALTLRGDVLLVQTKLGDEDRDLTGYAITGEAEYLAWDQGLSIFAGARYAQIEHDAEDSENDLDFEHTQIFGGIKFYFGQDGTLAERQRNAPVDNSSMFKEKLPQLIFSAAD